MKDQNRLDASIRPYNVFINHRGPDVKETVVSIIYQLLTDKGLSVFFDKREFEPGEEIDDAITHAIRTSSVHIAISSPRYAESHWRLDELCLILLESGAKIIPVFYDVPPRDLMRLQKGEGKYADALQKLENKVDDEGKFRFDRQRVRGWKEALKNVVNVSGFELGSKIFNGDVGELVQSIVARVMEHFRIAKKPPNEALNDTIDDFDYFLSESRKNNKNVRTVGIVGTAGSGKTTLAEEYYYRKLQYFDRSSFLLGVRNASRLQTLQSQLLEDLTRDQVKINNISSGKEILEVRIACLTRQKCLKFLIVIDDVDNREQLQALLLNETLLGPESWVIVTSRDGAIFKLSGISLHYKIQPMCADDAQKLFCTEAFHQAEPIPGFKDLVATALRKCGKLPLFLKLVGGHLHLYGNNNRGYCERELEIISDIADILKISYAALGEEEKQIFLDIACFFEGMDKNSAIRFWDGLGWRGARAIQKMEYMCLVQIDENNQLKMNASHSNLAEELADQQLYDSPDLPCRLWRPSEATNFLGGLLPVPV